MTLSLPLPTPADLHDQLGDPHLRIVDCRFALDDPAAGRRDYAAGHVPGAIYLSLDDDLTGPEGPGRHPLPDPAAFATLLGEVGIDDRATVVAYDAAGGAFASRLWWMLRSLGHPRAGVLDGGWPAWVGAGLPVTSDPAAHQPTTFPVSHGWAGTVDRIALEPRLGRISLVDARAPERFRGETEPWDPIAGRIPTAVNAPWAGNLTGEGTFRPVDELRTRYADLGPDVVVYCGSGVTACHDILAMEVAGITGAALYPGSWSDWSTGGGAVATGPPETP